MATQQQATNHEKRQGVAHHITVVLGETDKHPIILIKRIVKTIGEERALAILAQTQEVEAHGGMLLPDGSRKRTPGGVFFKLVREQVTRRERRYIYYPQTTPQEQPGTEEGVGEERSGEQPTETHSAGRLKDAAT